MTETGKSERRFQFSLRKLLLWTTAVAVLLGVLQMMEIGATGVAVVLAGIAILGVLRSAFDPRQALILWTLVSAIAGVIIIAASAIWELVNANGPSHTEIVLDVTWLSFWGIVFGGAIGGITYTLTDAACGFLDWLDSLMQSGDAR